MALTMAETRGVCLSPAPPHACMRRAQMALTRENTDALNAVSTVSQGGGGTRGVLSASLVSEAAAQPMHLVKVAYGNASRGLAVPAVEYSWEGALGLEAAGLSPNPQSLLPKRQVNRRQGANGGVQTRHGIAHAHCCVVCCNDLRLFTSLQACGEL